MAEPPFAKRIRGGILGCDSVKQDGHIVNKAAYMVIGIDLDGNKDFLGMWIGENESSKKTPAAAIGDTNNDVLKP